MEGASKKEACEKLGVAYSSFLRWQRQKPSLRKSLEEADQTWRDNQRIEYKEYKNWRGIPKPGRCPFCKQAKGEIHKVRGGFQGTCPNCGAVAPKRESSP